MNKHFIEVNKKRLVDLKKSLIDLMLLNFYLIKSFCR